jgi:FAD/FMN-containing dehydrogenase
MTMVTPGGLEADDRPLDAVHLEDRPEVVRASFGENYTRLRQVKTMYDPTNLFHLNANIPPA